MSQLVAAAFEDTATADRVLEELVRLQKQYLIDLEDACVVIRDEKGDIRLKQAYNLMAGGALGGAVWGGFLGALLGMLFLNPLAGGIAGAAAGAAGGAVSGGVVDYGIDDDFIRSLGKTIKPGTSALFVLVRRAQPDRVIDELKPFKAQILYTSLSAEDEAKLRAALAPAGVAPAQAAAPAPPLAKTA